MVKASSSHGLDRKFKSWRRGKSTHSKRRSSLKQQLRGYERLLQRLVSQDTTTGTNADTVATTADTAAVHVDARRGQLQDKIRELQTEMAAKQQSAIERRHAQQSHGVRFLERQKLVRMERNVLRTQPKHQQDKDNDNEDKGDNNTDAQEQALLKIALDQVYVAHYPVATSTYVPLFLHGVRIQDDVSLKRWTARARARAAVLEQLWQNHHHSNRSMTTKSWISSQQYDRVYLYIQPRITSSTSTTTDVPSSYWSVNDERAMFGGGDVAATDTTTTAARDDRFRVDATNPRQAALLAAVDQMEAELDHNDQDMKKHATIPRHPPLLDNDDDDDNDDDSIGTRSSSDDDDSADPLKQATRPHHNGNHPSSSSMDPKETKTAATNQAYQHETRSISKKKKAQDDARDHDSTLVIHSESSSDSSSDSDSTSSDSDSTSSDSSSCSDDDDEEQGGAMRDEPSLSNHPTIKTAGGFNPVNDHHANYDHENDNMDHDDFLVPVTDDAPNVFSKPQEHMPALDPFKGDKSQGWATQRQRPGKHFNNKGTGGKYNKTKKWRP